MPWRSQRFSIGRADFGGGILSKTKLAQFCGLVCHFFAHHPICFTAYRNNQLHARYLSGPGHFLLDGPVSYDQRLVAQKNADAEGMDHLWGFCRFFPVCCG